MRLVSHFALLAFLSSYSSNAFSFELEDDASNYSAAMIARAIAQDFNSDPHAGLKEKLKALGVPVEDTQLRDAEMCKAFYEMAGLTPPTTYDDHATQSLEELTAAAAPSNTVTETSALRTPRHSMEADSDLEAALKASRQAYENEHKRKLEEAAALSRKESSDQGRPAVQEQLSDEETLKAQVALLESYQEFRAPEEGSVEENLLNRYEMMQEQAFITEQLVQNQQTPTESLEELTAAAAPPTNGSTTAPAMATATHDPTPATTTVEETPEKRRARQRAERVAALEARLAKQEKQDKKAKD